MQVGFGPGPDGRFHPNVLGFFGELGEWLGINGKGIYHTRPCEDLIPAEHSGIYYTRSKDSRTLYVFLTRWPGEKLTLENIHPKPGSVISIAGFDHSLPWKNQYGSLIINFPDAVQSGVDILKDSSSRWMAGMSMVRNSGGKVVSGQLFERLQVPGPGALDNIFGQFRRGWGFIPVQAQEVVADELLVETLLGPSGLIEVIWPEPG